MYEYSVQNDLTTVKPFAKTWRICLLTSLVKTGEGAPAWDSATRQTFPQPPHSEVWSPVTVKPVQPYMCSSYSSACAYCMKLSDLQRPEVLGEVRDVYPSRAGFYRSQKLNC